MTDKIIFDNSLTASIEANERARRNGKPYFVTQHKGSEFKVMPADEFKPKHGDIVGVAYPQRRAVTVT